MTNAVQICLDSRQRVASLVIAMAGMVEAAVDQAIASLLANDSQIARSILQRESVINRMEIHLDQAILAYMQEKSCPAQDLRLMGSLLKVNKDLERMGDLAANVARKVIEMAYEKNGSRAGDHTELQPLAIAVSHICRKSLRAVVRQDQVLAESVSASKGSVDEYRDYVFHAIRDRLESGASEGNSGIALLLASRYLEQMANHAVNLADNLLFWMRGKPEGERISRPGAA